MWVKSNYNLTGPCESNINGSSRPLEDPVEEESLMFLSFRHFMNSKTEKLFADCFAEDCEISIPVP